MVTRRTTNGLITYRMDKVEEKVDDMNESIEKIMTNHLPHIQEAVIDLKTRINFFTGVNFILFILEVIFAKLLK